MRYRYYFCDRYNPRVKAFLDGINIRYEVIEYKTLFPLIKFDLFSTSDHIKEYLIELEQMKVGRPIVYAEYSASEISNANLVWISPKKQCIDIINNEEAYSYSCEYLNCFGKKRVAHKEQQSLFAVAKEPSMKSATAFWTEDTGFAELFTDWRVRELAIANSLTGIDFKNVFLRKGKLSEKLYQVTSQCVIKRDCIGTGYGEKIETCHICGKEQYVIDNAYQLHLDFSRIQSQSDLYVTEKIFGQGMGFPLFLVSQRFYQLLKQNKLTGGITVSPVAEI